VLSAGIGAIILLFVISALLKTAQGSSTVALVVGYYYTFAAGISSSMTVSHVNDSYFWVVSQFSGITIITTIILFALFA